MFLAAALVLLSSCAVVRTTLPPRIALLAPFEGRYREMGYNAYYAIRLAFADANLNVEFLPIDDGGSAASAVERARALALDPQVQAALVMGYAATSAETQQAFGDVPLLVIGHWSAQPQREGVFLLASPELGHLITTPASVDVTDAAHLAPPLVGGEVFALAQFPLLREQLLENVILVSSASLPDAAFTERYQASAEFAPAPNLLATLAYDAARIAIQAVTSSATRAEAVETLSTTTFEGINGSIRFADGYWLDAPIHYYVYDENRQLTAVDGIVEQR
ncbi:MAG: ABC transporter substrate-binding protein [Anaerolineae bacterium]